ncbi:MAG: N-acetyltransferase [Nitrospirota bacterium]
MAAKSIEIIEVKSDKELRDFIEFPFTIYARDPFHVPPLRSEIKKKFSKKNPFFLHASVRYFIARFRGKNAGRITSIINRRHIEFHGEKTGFFGFFECINDTEVAAALLDKVSESLKEEGMDIIRGPMNFSTNEECGLLLEGFERPPMLMTPYNPSYYNDLMDKYGMRKSKDLYAYMIDIPEKLPDKIMRVAEMAERKGIMVRPFNKKRFNREMDLFKDVYNSAWAKNWGFIPITDDELVYLGESLRKVIIPELAMIAVKDGEPVGFMGLLPDFNYVLKYMQGKINVVSMIKAFRYSRRIKDLRLLLLGIKAEYRNRGVEALFFREGFKAVRGRYEKVEFSWILEDNIPTQRLVEMIGGKLYKKYRIYEKRL